MKKLFYSLMTLAAALTVTSCLKEVEGGSAAYDDGTLVDATFSVTLGPQTKAFADGTTVDQLYAGIYEIGGTEQVPTYTYVAHTTEAVAIENVTGGRGGSVTFTGKIHRGSSYKVVFWAQKEGAPYTLAWGDAAPTVTVTPAGEANAENRDAFYGEYLTGEVSGNIDLTGSPITLKRPFAQVNVLVPTANFTDATAAVTSSMTVAQAPTVLNLATKATSDPADWTFSTAIIDEDAFGSYASTHKYVAMNYVLVPQDAAGASYNVTFSVTSAASTPQVAADKQVKNTPLKPNGRTNIVGNIFAEDFDITIPIVIGPTPGTDQIVTEVTVAVGQDQANAVALTPSATTSIEVGVNHAIEVEADKPAITVEPASFGTAEWNLATGKLDVTPSVANGNAVITLVFPAVTKAEYSAATVQIYVKVGNGQNEELEQVVAPTFSPAAGEVAAGTQVTITTTTEEPGDIRYKLDDGEYQSYTGPITITEAVTITAYATKTGMADSEETVAAYTIAAAAKTLTGIEVTTNPTKTAYVFGESFVPTGMVVTATYSDASKEEVTGYTTNAETVFASTGADKDVTVTYQEMTATFKVTITPATIATPVIKINDVVPTNETKVKADDVIKITTETTGVAIKYQIGEGSQNDYTDAGITLADADVTGDNVSIIFIITKDNYTTLDQTCIYAVDKVKTLTGITVTTAPTKTTYNVGDPFDAAGMVVTATYSDESTAEVTGYTTDAATVLATAGENKNVTVSYTEGEVTRTATFKVTVNASLITVLSASVLKNVGALTASNGSYTEEFSNKTVDGITLNGANISINAKNTPQISGAKTDSQKIGAGQFFILKASGDGHIENSNGLAGLKSVVIELVNTSSTAPTNFVLKSGSLVNNISDLETPQAVTTQKSFDAASGDNGVSLYSHIYSFVIPEGHKFFKLTTNGSGTIVCNSITVTY